MSSVDAIGPSSVLASASLEALRQTLDVQQRQGKAMIDLIGAVDAIRTPTQRADELAGAPTPSLHSLEKGRSLDVVA